MQLTTLATNVKKSMGGNAAVMATRFAKEGIGEVLLGAQLSNSLQSILSSDITVTGPLVEQDDVNNDFDSLNY